MTTRIVRTVAFLVAFAPWSGGYAQSVTAAGAPVSPADRAAIEQLLAAYNQALSSCASAEYAGLFTPDGTFTSDDFRGATHRRLYGKAATLSGHDKLVELVETEEFCLNPRQRDAREGAPREGAGRFSNLVLDVTAAGIRGVLPLANGGRYEDVYAKTADGWKFKSRKVVMPPAPR
jgi:hypothetical protein